MIILMTHGGYVHAVLLYAGSECLTWWGIVGAKDLIFQFVRVKKYKMSQVIESA